MSISLLLKLALPKKLPRSVSVTRSEERQICICYITTTPMIPRYFVTSSNSIFLLFWFETSSGRKLHNARLKQKCIFFIQKVCYFSPLYFYLHSNNVKKQDYIYICFIQKLCKNCYLLRWYVLIRLPISKRYLIVVYFFHYCTEKNRTVTCVLRYVPN